MNDITAEAIIDKIELNLNPIIYKGIWVKSIRG